MRSILSSSGNIEAQVMVERILDWNGRLNYYIACHYENDSIIINSNHQEQTPNDK